MTTNEELLKECTEKLDACMAAMPNRILIQRFLHFSSQSVALALREDPSAFESSILLKAFLQEIVLRGVDDSKPGEVDLDYTRMTEEEYEELLKSSS